MVPTALGQTDLGRDLLAQDYIFKQLTASLIYPEKDLGKEFWSRVYAKAQAQFGTTNVPVNTFNKVWILPDQAQVFENVNAAYVTKSTLKVMLDEDYLASKTNARRQGVPAANDRMRAPANNIKRLGSQIVREIVIPEITKEVNTGKNFAPLRQIYQALILAKWYKETIQNGLLDALYTNKNKVAGVNLNDPSVKEKFMSVILKAYKKGAFNYIKEDPTPGGQVLPRKYFSGGTFLGGIPLREDATPAMISAPDGAMAALNVMLKSDQAMTPPAKVVGTSRNDNGHITHYDANGKVTGRSYEEAGRRTDWDASGKVVVGTSHNDNGHITHYDASGKVTGRSYEEVGRRTDWDASGKVVVGTSHNDNGHITHYDARGKTTGRSYEEAGRKTDWDKAMSTPAPKQTPDTAMISDPERREAERQARTARRDWLERMAKRYGYADDMHAVGEEIEAAANDHGEYFQDPLRDIKYHDWIESMVVRLHLESDPYLTAGEIEAMANDRGYRFDAAMISDPERREAERQARTARRDWLERMAKKYGYADDMHAVGEEIEAAANDHGEFFKDPLRDIRYHDWIESMVVRLHLESDPYLTAGEIEAMANDRGYRFDAAMTAEAFAQQIAEKYGTPVFSTEGSHSPQSSAELFKVTVVPSAWVEAVVVKRVRQYPAIGKETYGVDVPATAARLKSMGYGTAKGAQREAKYRASLDAYNDYAMSVPTTQKQKKPDAAMTILNRRQFLFGATAFSLGGVIDRLLAQEANKPAWGTPEVFQVYDSIRRDVRPATRTILDRISKAYFGSASEILELGSGEGELYGLSSEGVRKILTQSDVVQANLDRNPYFTPKKLINVYKIPYSSNSLPGVVSLAVLDTLYDLKGAMKEIHRVLTKDGVMVAYTDLVPSTEVAMSSLPGSVLFPTYSYTPGTKIITFRRNYLRVDRNDLLAKIAKNGGRLDPKLLEYLNLYIANPIDSYNSIIEGLQLSDQHSISNMFKDLLKTLEVEYSQVDGLDMFIRRLGPAVLQAGFQVIESKIESGEAIVDRDTIKEIPPEANEVVFHTGSKYFVNDPQIPKGKVKVVSNIYVVVAKKSSNTSIQPDQQEGNKKVDNAQLNGGIDLNQINVLRNGKTVNVQFDPAQLNALEQGGFEGFTPVIINITHISSPFQLLGINPPKQTVLAKA